MTGVGPAEGTSDLSTKCVCNSHTSSWLKITNMGKSWRHEQRFRETTINNTGNMYVFINKRPQECNRGPAPQDKTRGEQPIWDELPS